ncbi:unnamed protein product [Calypogeia fissa]
MAQDLDFLPPSVQISKGKSFAAILDRFSYLFGVDDNGEEIVPPRIPLCQMKNLELVCNLNSKGPGVRNLKDSFMLHGYVKDFPGFQLLLVDKANNLVPLTDKIKSS